MDQDRVMLTTHTTRDTCQTLVSYGQGSSCHKEVDVTKSSCHKEQLYLSLESNGNVCFHDIFVVVTTGKRTPKYIGERHL